jgi:hypothetical protein
MGRPQAPCGTYSAYRRHLRDHEPVDDACRAAQHARDVKRSDSTTEVGAGRRQSRHGAEGQRPALSLVPPLAHSREPAPAESEQVDVKAELLANLALVRAAMAVVALEDPKRLAPLSKRHSELLTEVKTVGAADSGEADPFDAFLGGPAGLPTTTPRKSS